MRTLKKRARRVLRSAANRNATARKVVYMLYDRPKTVNGANYAQVEGKNFTVIRSRSAPDAKRVGIYLRGGCDLGAMFGVTRLVRESVDGTLAMRRDSIEIAGTRSDLLLQALDGVNAAAEEAMHEVSRRLRLNPAYFDPRVFEPTFRIPREADLGEFPKTVVVLSIGSDVTRSAYRHKEHEFLVDPGGFWLSQSISQAMADPDSIAWFAKNFQSVGRLSIEEFRSLFTRLLSEIKARTSAHVVVFNTLTVDPLERTHNFGLVKQSDTARRLDFSIALAELSRKLDFDVLDVDRILKLQGVAGQVDFAHFVAESYAPIGEEAYRILKEREVI